MTISEKRQQIDEWIAAGKWDVSPMQAAPIMNYKQAYAFNVAAKQGLNPQLGYFRGCRYRIHVSYLDEFVRNEEKALAQMNARAGGIA